MMICLLIKIFIIFSLTQLCCSRTMLFMQPIPIQENCIKIGKPGCKDLNLVPLTKEKIQQYELAHNGIRSRVAERFMIATMLRMYWDPQMYQMAKQLIVTCKRSLDTECVKHNYHHETETTPINKLISQNTAFVDTLYSYVPYNFEITQFTKWYNEGGNASIKVRKSKEGNYFRLSDNGNFTNMANPNCYRFGCASATFNRSYAVVCNYLFDPIRRDYFKLGVPGSECESEFPRRSLVYDRLCAADHVTSLKFSTHLYALIIILLLIV